MPRKAIKFVAVLLAMTLSIAGCNAASWLKLVGELLPLAAQVATQFYTYSNKGIVDAGDQQLIQSYTSDAQNILQTISNAITAANNPADKSTIQKVDALLAQLRNDSTVLLGALHVKDQNTIAFIQAMLLDASDLAALIPGGSIGGTITQSAVQARARTYKQIFQARLLALPK